MSPRDARNPRRTLLAEEVVLPREDDGALDVPDDGFALQLLPRTLPDEHLAAVWAARELRVRIASAIELARFVWPEENVRASRIQRACAGDLVEQCLTVRRKGKDGERVKEVLKPTIANAPIVRVWLRAHAIELPADPHWVVRWCRDCLAALAAFRVVRDEAPFYRSLRELAAPDVR